MIQHKKCGSANILVFSFLLGRPGANRQCPVTCQGLRDGVAFSDSWVCPAVWAFASPPPGCSVGSISHVLSVCTDSLGLISWKSRITLLTVYLQHTPYQNLSSYIFIFPFKTKHTLKKHPSFKCSNWTSSLLVLNIQVIPHLPQFFRSWNLFYIDALGDWIHFPFALTIFTYFCRFQTFILLTVAYPVLQEVLKNM